MPKEAPETMLGAMIALSGQVPHVPLQSACLALAEVIAKNERKLGPATSGKLLALSAALWQRSQELGEDVLDIQHITSKMQ
jgi:hypothetical protein